MFTINQIKQQQQMEMYKNDTSPLSEKKDTTFGVFVFCHNCQKSEKIADCGKTIFIYRYYCQHCQFSEQSSNFEYLCSEYSNHIRNWFYGGKYAGKSFIGSYVTVPSQYDAHLNLVEDVCLLTYQFIRSRNSADRAIAIVNFCKLRGSRTELIATLLDISDTLFNTPSATPSFESDIMDRLNFRAQDDDNVFDDVRNCLNMYDKMKELPIYKIAQIFYVYSLLWSFG